MRVLVRLDPRWVTLLLAPVLMWASAAQPQELTLSPPTGTVAAHLTYGMQVVPAPVPEHVQPAAQEVPDEALRLAVRADERREPRAARTRTHSDSRPTTLQERGAAALEPLPYDWRALGYTVRFRPYVGGTLGTANRRTRVITVYVKPGQSALSLRATFAHELGHALDFEHGTRERRELYRRIRDLPPSLPWFPCNRCEDYASPAGDFAEVFAAWLVGPVDFRSRLGGPPDKAQLRELAPLFQVPGGRTSHPAGPGPRATPAPEPSEDPDGGLPDLLGPPASPRPNR